MTRLGAFVVPVAGELEGVLAQVQAAEEGGLDLIGIQDHPYQRRFLDTFSLIPFLAARTTRVRLFPDVANLPLRHPAMLAKQAASLDVLSGGRFELGLGAGAFWDAIAAMGGPRLEPKASVDALEEAIAILRACWSGERTVSFAGRHYTVEGVHPGPPPVHDIGIWLGAYGPRMQRIAGRLADGWIPSIPRFPLEELAAARARIDAAAERAGRDPAAITRIANVNGVIADGPVTGYLKGPPSHWVEELTRLRDEFGFDGFVLWSEGDMIEQIVRFAAEVCPALRA
ncbi:LLM class flavin-dependent oxidoreductase [Candidatus Solirubrobacter pratensis]|uniref:LLM class flavin-dependent oxidoreductase n=1 Tax=Candidatus Solirubrobacter pratensis TaxID=1298857 RepID=UPI0004207106|nr:LLM class flavin-dependent oxidoreductase [Candidatus Solirubrobacter pratensis]